VDLVNRDGERVQVGQKASVRLAGTDGDPLSASVVEITKASDGAMQSALLEVAWPTARPGYGKSAQVAITVAQKEDTLLVPKRAVRSAGARRYVEYLEGANRRTATVQVGIVSPSDVEILSGLTEGQLVLAGL
jgi:macrolide-specific efflux system membrane fusion protein